MDDSSGDDQPIGARQIVKAASKLLHNEDDTDDSGSPMPEWISQHTPVGKAREEAASTSSDSDDVVDLVSPQAKEAAKVTKPAASLIAAGEKDVRKGNAKNEGFDVPKAKAGLQPGKPVKVSALPPAGVSQASAQVQAIPEAAAAGGSIPIVMPEKLAKGRFLVELEANENGAADLAGDAGAVGRFSMSGATGSNEGMLLDLKGCIYSASMTEAKVEAMFDSFMSLREEKSCNGQNNEDDANLFMFDDEDNYQLDEAGDKTKKPLGKRKAAKDPDDKPAVKKRKIAPKAKGTKGNPTKGKAAKKKAPAKGTTASKKQ